MDGTTETPPPPRSGESGPGRDDEPEPSRGAGRKGNVQRAPEDQRARPDPKQDG